MTAILNLIYCFLMDMIQSFRDVWIIGWDSVLTPVDSMLSAIGTGGLTVPRIANEYAWLLGSPKTARSIASETLQRPAVKAATQKALCANQERLQMLTAMAFYDPRDAIKFDPELGLVVAPDPNIIQSVRRVTRAIRELLQRLGAF